jgi:hypothetical protein
VADIEPKALRERCEKRLSGLKATRQPMEAHWREIESFFQVRKSR